jgi:glycosyltransferase 2 family protein
MEPATRPSKATPSAVWVALLVGLPLSALFLYLAARHADLQQVRVTVADADLGLLAMALGAVLGVFLLQAVRWRGIVNLGRPSRRRYVGYVFAGLACNNVLPGRIGDFLRARWLAQDGQLPYGRGLASVALDRIFDVVALVFFACVSATLVVSEVWLLRVAIGAGVLLAAFVIVRALATRYTSARDRGRRHRSVVRRIVRDTLEGLAEPLGWRRITKAIALSVAAWLMWALAAMLVATSVGVELGVWDALFVTAIVNLGAAIPSSPGFVGTFHWLAVQSLALLGIGLDEALAFAILMHAVWYVPTTLAGFAVLAVRAARTGISRASTDDAVRGAPHGARLDSGTARYFERVTSSRL